MSIADRWRPALLVGAVVAPLLVPVGSARGQEPGGDGGEQITELLEDVVAPTEGRAEHFHWWTNADGSRSAEVFSGPVFFEDAASGQWAPIDLELMPVADGLLGAAAGPAGLPRLSARSAGPVVTVESSLGRLSVSYPGADDVAGVVEGRSMRYPGALDGGRDLTVSLLTSGFKDAVVVADAGSPSAYLVEFELPAGIVARTEGSDVHFVDPSGAVVASYGDGLAWDSSEDAAGLPAEMPVWTRLVEQIQSTALVEVGVNASWLQNPARVFPVVIDPSYTETTSATGGFDGYLNSDNPDLDYPAERPGDGVYSKQIHMRTGTNGKCEAPYTSSPCPLNRTRTFLKFPVENVVPSDANITSATVKVFNYFSTELVNRRTDLYGLASSPSDHMTWNTQPGLDGYGVQAYASFAHGSTTSPCGDSQPPSTPSCGGAWVSFGSVASLVTRQIRSGNKGLTLRANQERDLSYHRRYYTSEFGYGYAPKLEVSWTVPTNAPSVTSSSHPDQGAWYSDDTVIFDVSSGRSTSTSWSYTIDTSATTIPDDTAEYTSSGGSFRHYLYNWPNGTRYYHIKYLTSSGWSAPTHYRVNVDDSPPLSPVKCESTSHNGLTATPDPTIDVKWSGATDLGGSKLAGYSWDFTASPDIEADTMVDIGPEQTAGTSWWLPSGRWYFHIRAIDQAGNAGSDMWCGGYLVESDGPPAPLVSSSTHPTQTRWYASDDPLFHWYNFYANNYPEYSYTLDRMAATVPDKTADTLLTEKQYFDLAEGTSWFHVRAGNKHGVWGQTAHFQVNIDETPPPAPSVASTTHSDPNACYANNDPTFTWSSSDLSGIERYGYWVDTQPDTDPSVVHTTTSTTHTLPDHADGAWYIHVKAHNGAGLYGPATHRRFVIDTTGPSATVAASSSHTAHVSSRDATVDVTWTASADFGCGLAGYSWSWNTSETVPADNQIEAGGGTTSTTSPELANGTWWFHVRPVDAVGNAGPDATYGPIVIDRDHAPLPPLPSLTSDPVAQSDENGVESFFPMGGFTVGTGGQGLVHLRTGNTVVRYRDVTVPAQGLNVAVGHVYNSHRRDHDGGLGRGWSLSVAESDNTGFASLPGIDPNALILSGQITETDPEGVTQVIGRRLELVDGDGTAHRFMRGADPGSRWTSPPGMDLKVEEDLDAAGQPTAYRLIRPDRVTYELRPLAFAGLTAASWRLTAIRDGNGNELTFDYSAFGTAIRLVDIRHNRYPTETALAFVYDPAGHLQAIRALPGRGSERTWTFDVAVDSGLLREVTETAAGTTDSRTVAFGYSADQLVLSSVRDARGNTTHLDHDADVRLTGVTDRTGHAWTYSYDPADAAGTQTTRAATPLGDTTTYTLSARGPVSPDDPRLTGGNPTRIADPGTDVGPVVTDLTWQANRLVARSDAAGTTSMTYDALGNLTHVTEPAGNVTRSTLPAEAPTGPVDTTLAYRYSHRLTYNDCATYPEATADPALAVCYAHADVTRTVAAANIAGQQRVTDYTYWPGTGNLHQLTQRAQPSGAAHTDDRTVTHTYYTYGGLKQLDGPRTDVTDLTVYGDTADIDYGGYHRSGQPTRITDAAGNTTTATFDDYGRTTATIDRDGRTSKVEHDWRGNPTAEIDPAGDRTVHAYDANDNPTTTTSPRGKTTDRTYDPSDRLTLTRLPSADATSPRSETRTTYYADGTIATRTIPIDDTTTRITTHTWWPNGLARQTRTTSITAAEAVTDHHYDTAGRAVRTVLPATTTTGTRPETRTSYAPNGAVVRTETTGANGTLQRVVEHAYNAHGQTIQTLGPAAAAGTREQRHSHDAFGQTTSARRLHKTGAWLESTYRYDRAGNLTRTTLPTAAAGTTDDLATSYTYDALNRLTVNTDPNNPGHETRWTYTPEGLQHARNDHNGAGTLMRSTTLAYTADGLIRQQTSTDHTTGTHLTACTVGGPDGDGYDADGNLLRVETRNSTTGCAGGTLIRTREFGYDDRGWLTSHTQQVRSPTTGQLVARTQTFTHKLDGAWATTTHDTAHTISYSYTAGGHLAQLQAWDAKTITSDHTPTGAPTTVTLDTTDVKGHTSYGDATGTYNYHPDGSVASMIWTRGSGIDVRRHTSIGYDPAGLRTAETVTIVKSDGFTAGNATATFTYDLADRLTAWTSPFVYRDGQTGRPTTTYTLDDAANITRELVTVSGVTRADTTQTYTTNRLTGRTSTLKSATGTTEATITGTYNYNALGDETNRSTRTQDYIAGTDTTAPLVTSHDGAGHVSRVDDRSTYTGAQPKDVDYTYDATGQVIARKQTDHDGTVRTALYFYWATSTTLAEETDGNGNTTTRYVIDDRARPIAQHTYRTTSNGDRDTADTSGTWSWLLADVDGNRATILRHDGTVIEQAAYAPYGAPQPTGSDRNDDPKDTADKPTSILGYQSAITDTVTGNVLLGPRQYDPTTTRFTSADYYKTVGLDLQLSLDPLTGNRYLFAGANPIAYDDDGHGPCSMARCPDGATVVHWTSTTTGTPYVYAVSKPHRSRGYLVSSENIRRFDWLIRRGAYDHGLGDLGVGVNLRAYFAGTTSWLSKLRDAVVRMFSSRRAPEAAIRITDEGLQHAIDSHTAFGPLTRQKSVFFDGEDLVGLIRRADGTVPLRQRTGNLAYVVDAGRDIGVDRFTGLPTSQYTVITRPDGSLVTTFPGLPRRGR